jgi:hypothetical protein
MENAEKPSQSCLVSRNREGKEDSVSDNLCGSLDGMTGKIVANVKI